ncbi:MAG: S9 family peptidase, partial [Gammaproteobacteria bacterium]|nr:S9 family peptidase [Gammaproteobacteria bacterium]
MSRTLTSSVARLLSLLAFAFALLAGPSLAREPVPIELLARVPDIQSVSMSTDGKNLVALVVAPGSKHQDTALATWNMEDLDAGPVVTPSGNRMKFIAANAMKADRILVIARQEWSGQLGGCGEGRTTGSTRTFVTKAYLTDTAHKKFDEAFADNTRKLGVSADIQRCLEIAGTASLVSTLPLDPDRVIIQQMNSMTLSGNYYLYNLRSGVTELLFKSGGRSTPG